MYNFKYYVFYAINDNDWALFCNLRNKYKLHATEYVKDVVSNWPDISFTTRPTFVDGNVSGFVIHKNVGVYEINRAPIYNITLMKSYTSDSNHTTIILSAKDISTSLKIEFPWEQFPNLT